MPLSHLRDNTVYIYIYIYHLSASSEATKYNNFSFLRFVNILHNTSFTTSLVRGTRASITCPNHDHCHPPVRRELLAKLPPPRRPSAPHPRSKHRFLLCYVPQFPPLPIHPFPHLRSSNPRMIEAAEEKGDDHTREDVVTKTFEYFKIVVILRHIIYTSRLNRELTISCLSR